MELSRRCPPTLVASAAAPKPKDRTSWAKLDKLAVAWLPRLTILHPWPDARSDRHHPSWEPGAVVPHAGFCAGGAG
jgi:hypothetical protein